MKKTSASSDLRFITQLVLPFVGLLLIVALGGTYLHQREMQEMFAIRDVETVGHLARSTSLILNGYQDTIEHLAIENRIELPDEISLHIPADFDLGIARLTPDCRLIDMTGFSSYWSNLIRTQSLRCSLDHSIQIVTGETPSILFLAPLNSGGYMMGALSAKLLAKESIPNVVQSSTSSLWLVDHEKNILYRSHEFAATDEARFLDTIDNQAHYIEEKIGSQEYLIAWEDIDSGNLHWIHAEAWNDTAGVMLRITQVSPLVLIPAIIFILLLVWFGFRQVILPLQRLEEIAFQIGQEDYQDIHHPVGGIDEIQRLQEELIDLTEKIQASQRSLHQYIGVITNAQEEERRRLARELHDDTLQALIALNQRLQMMIYAEDDSSLREQARELQQLAAEDIKNLRRLTGYLRPNYLEELGLVAALQMLTRQMQPTLEPCQIQFVQEGKEHRLPPETELSFYRIAQESLNNIARHADARQAEIRLRFQQAFAELIVEDNGKGFNLPESPAAFTTEAHYGLLGIYERAELIGAKLTITSEEDMGTIVRVHWRYNTTPPSPSVPSK
ncbi:MAG: hypothetical protein JW750_02455 [Anaerolineaceae bacterium]|nr:hypothetical protein [Anaerolineaceae bacterium]